MPTVVVEDGTLVAGANSFVTSALVSTYCDNRGYTWTEDDDAAARAVIKAGDYLKNTRRFVFTGALISATQTMPWPRTGGNFYRGPSIGDTVIPQCLKDAQCELAYRALVSALQPDLARGGRIKRRKVDVLETEFFEDAPSETLVTAVCGILQPVLVPTDGLYLAPYLAQPVAHSPWRPGEFSNPPTSYDADPSASS
jgi:hypothetical protein